MTRQPLLAHLSLIGLAAALCGCGKDDSISALGGGAHSPVAVTIIPKASEGGGGGGGGTDVAVAGYGNVKGRVTLSGAAPTLPPLVSESQVKPADKDVCIINRIPNQTLVLNGDGVANVFVYLSKAPKGAKMPEVAPAEVTMDHKYCTFIPHAMVVMTGQPIRILNDDAIAHNVHTKPTRNGEFNSGIGASNREGVTTSYKNAERAPAKVICDYHTWMSAWQLPLDHPYGAVTNDNGEFEIKDLPAGKHEFVIWHEGREIAKKTVTVEVDQTVPFDLTFTAADFKVSAAADPRSKTVVLSMNH